MRKEIITQEILFEVASVLGRKIRTTKFYWENVIIKKHKDVKRLKEEVKTCLKEAEIVEASKLDITVHLYYKRVNKKYICVVAKHLNEHGFVITAHIASKLRKGEIIWPEAKNK